MLANTIGMELTLKTERLTLRDLRPSDLEVMHALRPDPMVAQFMDFSPETGDDTHAWLVYTVDHNQRRPRSGYNFAIVRMEDERTIGWIGIGTPSRPGGRYQRELDFGYALRPSFWGRGYMTESLRAVLEFAFDQLAAEYIYGECDARNTASARVMQKAGMRLERDGSAPPQDLRFGITADQWRAVQPQRPG